MDVHSREETSIVENIQRTFFFDWTKVRISSACRSGELEVPNVLVVEVRRAPSRSREPASNRVPGDSAGPGDGGPIEALDAQENDVVKRIAGGLDSVVGRARVGRERPAATRAPVSSSLACLGLEEAVPDDIALVHLSVPLTVYIGANLVDAARHGSPLCSAGQKLSLKCLYDMALRAGQQQRIREAPGCDRIEPV